MAPPQSQPQLTSELSAICEAVQKFLQIIFAGNDNSLSNMLRPFIFTEFEKADMSDTKSCIQHKVLENIEKLLNNNTGIEKPGITVSKFIMNMLEALYEKTKSNDVKLNALTTKYNAFKIQNHHDLLAVKNLVREFQKDAEISNENSTNKREKIIKNNDLNIILAIDGMLGYQPAHLVNYIHNLTVGDKANNVYEKHVIVIRELYKLLPSVLNGTDCTHYIALLLLKMYYPHISDLNYQLIVKNEITNINDYLFKQAEYFPEIKTIQEPDFGKRLQDMYCANINKNELVKLANDKVPKLIALLSKQQKNQDNNNKRKNETTVDEAKTTAIKKAKK